MCKSCSKTQAIIPNFLVPYKIHITQYITEVIKDKVTKNNVYNITCIKYQISRQLLKYWFNCFEKHLSRISTILCETNIKKLIRQIIPT